MKEDNVQAAKDLIQKKLDAFSPKELKEINYILSTYAKTAEASAGGEVPMHFFGRLAGLTRLDAYRVEMDLGLHNVNTYGVAQGGAVFTLADVAIGFLLLEELPEGQKVFTLELKINFIKKGKGVRLIATPKIISAGKTIVVAECNVEDEFGVIVAKALGTFFLSR
ncbi:hypothetical protein SporoP37_07260 [Sporosarcina sp. P37]|uniref:PaaI family thioesterase n=1 Tax=unclassified Sporosarcina TaxID=2647733 RepID=UPI0009BE03DE|nr:MULTISPECIES: PaaI family thioesterase [unclassified Sporosarcina]ARD47962.1 hypothetical protein SporoP33_06785 [Sporosarcina sp. P33]ARK24487.1 hypothetical protein SporoP37_07260 [Sporosarcina sp. P37]PID18362.1 PaaI family thioesterase [Sporosarcina sp. P35]